MDDLKEYWRTWLWRDAMTRIITINFIVWLVISVIGLFSPLTHSAIVGFLALPSSFSTLLHWHPWSVVTYMFTQVDFLHLLVNMMWFMIFGRLISDFQSPRRLVVLYVYGGIAGALGFIIANMLANTGGIMIGASCAVLAVTAAAAVLYPNFRINLLFLGSVKIIWLVIAATILFIVEWASLPATVAHAAGAAVGVVYGYCKKQGTDITAPVLRAYEALLRRRVPTAKPMHKHADSTDAERQEMDGLLQKVSRSGYQSLTAKERQRLFDLSQKMGK